MLACPDVRGAFILDEDFSQGWPTGWVIQNNSNPIGTKTWALGGQDTVLKSSSGGQDFASVNYESAGNQTALAPMATASDWLITPAITLETGDTISFSTSAFVNQDYPDRLQLRLNTANAGTNTGNSETSVGDFATLLLDINSNYATTGQPGTYPTSWTTFTATVSGLAGPTSGRLAFRYYVEDSGPDGTRGNEIGIDNVSVMSVPEPGAATTLAVACGLAARRRRRSSRKSTVGATEP